LHHPGRAAVAKLTILICALGATNPALACSMRGPPREPNLQTIVQYGRVVFIGTVVYTDGELEGLSQLPMGGRAKFKVEIPVRGEPGEIFEIRNGEGSDCKDQFQRGVRYFFSGCVSGSSRADGSAALPTDGQKRDTYLAKIFQIFPEAQSLPPPERVVANYLQGLPEKEREAERVLWETQEARRQVFENQFRLDQERIEKGKAQEDIARRERALHQHQESMDRWLDQRLRPEQERVEKEKAEKQVAEPKTEEFAGESKDRAVK
jgi:hypothetical protein